MSKKTIIITSSIIGVLALIGLIFIFVIDKNVKTYNVSFETNGGTAVDSQKVNEGELVKKPEDPTKEGYMFVQWLYQGKTYDFSNVVNSNLVLTAEWVEKEELVETYLVIFNSDGGTTIPNQIVEEGNKIQKPEDPTKEGYNFKGWFLNEIEYNFETIVQNNIELKASWEKIKNDKPANNNKNKPSNNGNNNDDNTKKPETPTLKNYTLTACGKDCPEYVPELSNGKYYYDLGINKLDYDKSISGYAIYEKNGDNYKEIASNLITGSDIVEVSLMPGEKKTYVARVYAINPKNEKIYSNYSNEVIIDHSKLETPTLKNDTLTACGKDCPEYVPELSNGKYYYDLVINKLDYDKSISGYAIYEKNGDNYKEIASNLITGSDIVEVSLMPGEKKTYVARVYAINPKNEKIYSNYSNEVIIDHSKLETPTLKNDTLTACGKDCPEYVPELSNGKYYYDLVINKLDYGKSISGYAIYEKNGDNYKEIASNLITGSETVEVSLMPGEKKTYVARVYAINPKNEKIYSNYSNEVIIDHSK